MMAQLVIVTAFRIGAHPHAMEAIQVQVRLPVATPSVPWGATDPLDLKWRKSRDACRTITTESYRRDSNH